MKELSLALTLILTGLGMSQSKQFNPVPHAPPAAVEAISAEPMTTALNTTAAERVPPPSSTVPTSQAAVVSSDTTLEGDAGGDAETGESDACSKSAATSLPASFPTVAEQMLATNNRVRAAAGKPPQALDPRLTQAAQEQADHLARNNYRYTSSGSAHFYGNGSVETRAARYGFQGDLGENFAGNQHDLETAFEQWQESPGHARTLYGSYDRCGFGMAYSPTTGHTYWMAVYGREGPAFTAQPVKLQPRQSQPVYRQPQQTYRSYSQCGPGGCGPSGFRPVRRFRGR
jgi:uncharacterized protein YkwD